MNANHPAQVGSRVAASLLGSYAFVFGFTTLGTALGVAAGMPYADAQTLLYLLAFLRFALCFCWAFLPLSGAKVWGGMLGGGAVMTGAGWLLSQVLGAR